MLSSKHKFIRTISAGIYSLPHYDVNLLNCLFLKKKKNKRKRDQDSLCENAMVTAWRSEPLARLRIPRAPTGQTEDGLSNRARRASLLEARLGPSEPHPLECVSPGSKESQGSGLGLQRTVQSKRSGGPSRLGQIHWL